MFKMRLRKKSLQFFCIDALSCVDLNPPSVENPANNVSRKVSVLISLQNTVMRKFTSALCLLALISVIYSCQKALEKQSPNQTEEIPGIAAPTARTICGTAMNVPIVDYNDAEVGNLTLSNDASNYYFDLSENLSDYKIEEVRWLYGTEDHVRTALLGLISCGLQVPATADQVTILNPGQDQVSLTVPIANLPGNCIFFHVHIKVVKRDPITGQEYYEYWTWSNGTTNASQNQCQRYFQYCKQQCTPPTCGQLRTQTQGGWGAVPHGNNPGTYLYANFAGAFPSGLTVGCTTGHWVKYTNAAAITEFLPAGGTPGVLTANATNPADKSIKNVLIGQVTALALSVGFDNYDSNFGAGGVTLGNMVIGSGTFAGKTVSQFLTIANDVLGGCSNAYSPSTINDVATKINENYDDGKTNNGFLVCPGSGPR